MATGNARNQSNPSPSEEARAFDARWAGICETILEINLSSGHEGLRYEALRGLARVVPYDSAAFFAASEERDDVSGQPANGSSGNHAGGLGGCIIAQPLGIDIEMNEFLNCLSCLFERSSQDATTRVEAGSFAVALGEKHGGGPYSVSKPNLEGAYLLACRFEAPEALLGALVLTRDRQRLPFSQREVKLIEALAPHISVRLADLQKLGLRESLSRDRLREVYGLTKRELDVVASLVYGMTTPEIAVKLSIAPATVKRHLANIYRKIGVNNRMSLMKFAQQFMTAASG